MLIGVDASRAVKANRTGTENYSWYLLRELLAIDRQNRYRLYAPHLPEKGFGEYPNVEWKILPPRRLWSQFSLAKELRANPPDLLFVPSHVVPLFSRVPAVVMIHGFEYKHYPESYRALDRRYLELSTGISVGKAKRILVPSAATKADLLKEYKIKPDRVVVTPLGYDDQLFHPATGDEQSPYSQPYIFFIGRVESRKNVKLLVEAFGLLAKEIKNVQLVIAGKPGHGYEAVTKTIDGLPTAIKERITLAGYLSETEAARAMRHAAAFCFPSLYEGFGIPVLEAMASGTPVISSNASSLPEVAGTAAVQLAPENPLSWAAAMSRIIHQSDHAAKLRTTGLEQAKQFSWRKTAEQTLAVLNDVAA